MRYGFFDDDRCEYVIERPDTPLPWINYLGSGDYVGLISNTAGGYSYYRDARLRRLTRYRYNNVPTDVGGRYLYLRDAADERIWSPTWQPVRTPLDEYSCRHGMGYTIIRASKADIVSEVRYFVPLAADLEVWDLTLHNQRAIAAELDLFSLVEFALWDAQDDATNFQRNLNIGEVEIVGDVIYHKTEYRERRSHFAFFACSAPLEGFDTQRECFFGPYRGWERPRAVVQGHAEDSVAHGFAPIGSHHVKLKLAPDQRSRTIFLLGYHENPSEQKFDPPGSQQLRKASVRPVIDRYLEPSAVDEEYASLGEHWQQKRGILQVVTPDEHTNRMVNIWNPYQCAVTFNVSRSASYFESGVGRGIGFRDSNQDLLGSLHLFPRRARQRILDLAATQLQNGGAYHQFQPLTKRGNDRVGRGFNDDPLWLVLSTTAYVKEMGEKEILEQTVPFGDVPDAAAPLFDHLERSIQYTLGRLGPHGLPLIGRADWNDCLNLNVFSEEPGLSFQNAPQKTGGRAESVFIGALFIMAASEMADLSRFLGRADKASYYRTEAERMIATIEQHAWDGEWFLRAYDHEGRAIGSADREEGQIYLEVQGLCSMAGVGRKRGWAERALRSVNKQLASEHGLHLLTPPYSRYDPALGEVSTYPPGYKENGAVFCHANPWVMIAAAQRGDAATAFDYYCRISPSRREEISEIHRCEPYVYAQMIAGRASADYGQAKNSWLTGTAAWNYVAISQWMLGLRPTYDGLIVAPVIPREWDGFKATRRFRGVEYAIEVRREGPGQEVALEVDGAPIEGEVVPAAEEGRGPVRVLATLQ